MRAAHRLRLSVAATLISCAMTIGCTDESAKPAAIPPATSQPDAPRPPTFEPEYTLEIKPSAADAKKSTITWTARVNTGGWSMTTDRVLVEDSMGKTTARVYAVLESPGPDDMVGQAFQTLTGTHEADRRVDTAELSIKLGVRGVKPAFAPLYSVVKTAG